MGDAIPMIRGGRTERFAGTRYAAFRIPDGMPRPVSYSVELGAPPASVDEAVRAAMLRCFHKDHLAIREANQLTGAVRVHLYAVKKESRPNYEHDTHHRIRKVHKLYAAPVCVLDGDVLGLGE